MGQSLNIEHLKKIWILNLVSSHGSFKRASLIAKISPSAVSQSISSLESIVGSTLLIRGKYSVLPTMEASNLLKKVRPAFEIFASLDRVQERKAPQIKWMKFGTYESMAIDFIPGFIASMRQKTPALKLGLRIGRSSDLISMVKKGELSSALIPQVDDMGRLYVKEVTEDRLGIYVSKWHPIAQAGWPAIQKFGLGSLAPGKYGLPRYFMKFLKYYSLPTPTLLSDSFEILRVAAAAGSIAAILPNRVARRYDQLIEIFPSSLKGQSAGAKDIGLHKIVVIGRGDIARAEVDFIAGEALNLLV